MRVSQAPSTRGFWHDRNPSDLQSTQFTGSAVAPHGATTRWTYTVPTARKAYLGSLMLRWRRVTVAAPVGQITINFRIGGLQRALVQNTLNAVDSIEMVPLVLNMSLTAANAIDSLSTDLGTGGTCDIHTALQAVEYDA